MSCAVIMTPRRNIASSILPTRKTRNFWTKRLNISVGAKPFIRKRETNEKQTRFFDIKPQKNPIHTLRKERRDAHQHSYLHICCLVVSVQVWKWIFLILQWSKPCLIQFYFCLLFWVCKIMWSPDQVLIRGKFSLDIFIEKNKFNEGEISS